MTSVNNEKAIAECEGSLIEECAADKLDVVYKRLNPMSEELKQLEAFTFGMSGSFGLASVTSTH